MIQPLPNQAGQVFRKLLFNRKRSIHLFMSIANELSSDIAAAMLARKNEESSVDSSELKDVVMQVHSTLRNLTAEARRGRRRSQSSFESPTAKSAASNQ